MGQKRLQNRCGKNLEAVMKKVLFPLLVVALSPNNICPNLLETTRLYDSISKSRKSLEFIHNKIRREKIIRQGQNYIFMVGREFPNEMAEVDKLILNSKHYITENRLNDALVEAYLITEILERLKSEVYSAEEPPSIDLILKFGELQTLLQKLKGKLSIEEKPSISTHKNEPLSKKIDSKKKSGIDKFFDELSRSLANTKEYLRRRGQRLSHEEIASEISFLKETYQRSLRFFSDKRIENIWITQGNTLMDYLINKENDLKQGAKKEEPKEEISKAVSGNLEIFADLKDPVAEETVRIAPVIEITEEPEIERTEIAEPLQCSICFENVEQNACMTSCGHCFHESCAAGWFAEDNLRNDCPNCRKDLSSEMGNLRNKYPQTPAGINATIRRSEIQRIVRYSINENLARISQNVSSLEGVSETEIVAIIDSIISRESELGTAMSEDEIKLFVKNQMITNGFIPAEPLEEAQQAPVQQEPNVCQICLCTEDENRSSPENEMIALPCVPENTETQTNRHCFHKGCIMRWLRTNGRCPICRTRMRISSRGTIELAHTHSHSHNGHRPNSSNRLRTNHVHGRNHEHRPMSTQQRRSRTWQRALGWQSSFQPLIHPRAWR